MSSPTKRGRRPAPPPSSRLSDPSLPLHLALSYLLIKLYPLNSEREPIPIYRHTFISAILAIVMREYLEVSDTPVSFEALVDETDTLIKAEADWLKLHIKGLRTKGQPVEPIKEQRAVFESWLGGYKTAFSDVADGGIFLDLLEKDLGDRINVDDDEEILELPEPFERHSPIGIFVRKVLLTLRRLSFDETAALSRQCGEWCGVTLAGPSRWGALGGGNRKLAMEQPLDRRIKAFEGMREAEAAGDVTGGLAQLRKFYDYQFPSSGRAQHQHALLNLAHFHYSTGGLESARAALEEAIRVSRADGDKACLRHCMSLLHRLNTEASPLPSSQNTFRVQQTPISSSVLPKPTSPMDELWNLRAALDLGEPVHVAMRRIHLAMARYDQTSLKPEDKREPREGWTTEHDLDLAAWHAAQASLWGMMGSEHLCELHEDLALRSGGVSGDARLTVALARAERMTNKARYDDALRLLLDFDLLQGMNMTEYHRWTKVVWAVLDRRAVLNGDISSLELLDSLRPSPCTMRKLGPGGIVRDMAHPSPILDNGETEPSVNARLIQDEIRTSLSKVRKMQESKTPPHLSLPLVLSDIQLSSELGLWTLYRFGIVLMADILLSMEGGKLAQKAKNEVESIWDQVNLLTWTHYYLPT
ncbi:hypothetical protein BCR39DRAFT_549234 [Naematelia encephala]|uniref:Anaphase-promoting complex subunit 5 n=1 Tax=Naematelia encephala TaxID=71784 RepID=A0A1Y2AMH7_9TREE|nr:hypothetical protein BCR39DRAFT_549234 [Naematelia encephala]